MQPFAVPSVSAEAIPEGALLLDVREHEEWSAGHAPTAVHVPMNELPRRVAEGTVALDTQVPIVAICRVGGRSAAVTQWLVQSGYEAYNLDGGMFAWEDSGKPMVSENGAPARVL